MLSTGEVEILDIFHRNGNRYAKYKCSICDIINEKITCSFSRTGCPVCTNQRCVEGYNDITTTDQWMIPYFQGGYEEAKQYTSGTNKTIYPICPHCGRIKKSKMSISTIKRTKSIGCICGDGFSYPNKFMYALLSQLNLGFENEYSPDWIKPKKYDFYIPSLNLIIEMDGGLGHGKRLYTNSKLSLKESLENDIYKDDMATIHNLKVVRIESERSEFDYIVPKIKDRLKDYFDLSHINWNQCEAYALSNRVKLVCEQYEQHKPISTSELADKLHLSRVSVLKYLKKGSMLGWSNYNIDNGKKIGITKSAKTRSKTVYVYDMNGNFISEYKSLHDLQTKSVSDFGFYLSCQSVSRCCNGKLKSYKGLIFTYKKKEI